MSIFTKIIALAMAVGLFQSPDEAIFEIDASRVIHRVSPLLHGACIEDVNHEIYGGLYSQMIFGESFQEPARVLPLKGFTAVGGRWVAREGVLEAAPGDGPKLISDEPAFVDGEVGVEVKFPSDQGGNAGLIVRVDKPGEGADAFTGYEVSLETSGFLVLGRHRRNWEPLRRVACVVPIDRWIPLAVRMKGKSLEVLVDGQSKLNFEDTEHPLAAGGVGLRDWQRPASYRNFRIKIGDSSRQIAFEPRDPDASALAISGMWGAERKGSARGQFTIEERDPFIGRQAQRLTYLDGEGAIGIENRGLNRWGLNLVVSQPYEGYFWARSEATTRLTLALESGDGVRRLAETSVEVKSGGWAKYDFTMKPAGPDSTGRFAILLEQPGSVVLGHVFLQPGDWGRFKGLPVRKDVAEGLIDQGIAVLRYGGSMVNNPQYRWKSMIGPRDRRSPYRGMWYPYSTHGWGIFDFLNFCEAAGFLGIPAVNMGETPQDMADFIEYANGSAETPWGRKRVADGHPEPYRLKHLELGNEEAVNEDYWKKFEPMAEAIWAKDPGIILVVGDFAYGKVIQDPYKFEGGAVVNTLAAHKKILELARARGREVWFDIHVWTDHPPEPNALKSERSYIDQLGNLAPGVNYKVVFFEYNSGNHAMKRALSNALATIEAERIGDLLPIACAANCLQPDGQNDNGWDQGLLFLDPSKVWLQPPGFLVQMSRRHLQPLLVHAESRGRAEKLSVNARRSEDGKTLVLQVVNWDNEPRSTRIEVTGFTPSRPSASVEQMAGPLEAANTAREPDRITPRRSDWKHEMQGGKATYSFPPRSITFLRFD
jgi:Domain of Unknown Function (DUF1080)/Alpha-L-arabinofuranosidase C-terminal domain